MTDRKQDIVERQPVLWPAKWITAKELADRFPHPLAPPRRGR